MECAAAWIGSSARAQASAHAQARAFSGVRARARVYMLEKTCLQGFACVEADKCCTIARIHARRHAERNELHKIVGASSYRATKINLLRNHR
eukprot:6191359-Pleurochrysis_carterae.AAC.10